MADLLPPSARRELQKGLAHCGACRLKLEALRDVGLDVTAELDRLEKTQQVAEGLLRLEHQQGPAK